MMETVQIYLTMGGVILGVFLGGLITWLCSKHYYERAAKELTEKTREVKRLVNYILIAMEQKGLATLSRDSQGNIIGYKFTAEVHGAIMPTGSSSPTLTQSTGEENNERR